MKTTQITSKNQESPYLQPVEKPGLLMKLAYRMSQKKYGRILSPLSILYARLPFLLSISMKFLRHEKKLSISDELVYFVKVTVASRNHCEFCTDIALATAVQKKLGMPDFQAILSGQRIEILTEDKRLVLQYIDESLRHDVQPDTFQNMRRHYSEKEILEILWLVAMETYWNIMGTGVNMQSDRLYQS